jgi:hypothetical protein
LKVDGYNTSTSEVIIDVLETMLSAFIQHREAIIQALAIRDKHKPIAREEGDES